MRIFKQGCDTGPIQGKSHVAPNMHLEKHRCKDSLEDDDLRKENEHSSFPLALKLCVGDSTLLS